jgi:NIMA (never in mitosis gene a)-related kinase
MIIRGYQVETLLGEGSFGKVFKTSKNGRTLALKVISLRGLDKEEKGVAIREVEILSKISHRNVVKHLDSFRTKDDLNIVMEFCDGGDLSVMLKRRRRRFLPEKRVWRIVLQIFSGLGYLHKNRILHRDMKTANCFLCKNKSGDLVKIGDFGVARVLGTKSDFARTMVGTPYYLSPELCSDKPYDAKSDIWALGCIVYECCKLEKPFDARNQAALIVKILKARYAGIGKKYSSTMQRVISRCLDKTPSSRPSIRAMLNWPSLRNRVSKYCDDDDDSSSSSSSDESLPELYELCS